MKNIQILVHGRHPEILETVLRVLNRDEQWSATGSLIEETIIEQLQQGTYDILLLGGGIDQVSEQKLRTLAQELSPGTKIVQHYGGGSGLLRSEIETALKSIESTHFKFKDNPFS